MTEQGVALCGTSRILADQSDHVQHVEEDAASVATGMAEHVEGGIEQQLEGDGLKNEAKPAIRIDSSGRSFHPCRANSDRPVPR